MKTNIHFWSYLAQFFLDWEMFQAKVVEKIKTHILCSVNIYENRGFYEIMWKNYVEGGRLQMAICRMHLACCLTKATKHSLTIYNTYCFSTATVVKRTRLNDTLYMHCPSCLVFLKTEYQYNNAFAIICDNHATSCSFYPWILVPAVNRVLRAVICGIPLFHGDLMCMQSPFHYCAGALQPCSVLKCEICVLQRRSQISCNWVLCDTVKATSHHTKPNWTEPRRNWGTNCHLNRFLWIVLRERESDSDWWCVLRTNGVRRIPRPQKHQKPEWREMCCFLSTHQRIGREFSSTIVLASVHCGTL